MGERREVLFSPYRQEVAELHPPAKASGSLKLTQIMGQLDPKGSPANTIFSIKNGVSQDGLASRLLTSSIEIQRCGLMHQGMIP